MNDHKTSEQDEVKGSINPVVVTVAGAVIGAGIAVAGVLLSDENNRENIMKAATTVKDDVTHLVEKTQKHIEAERVILEKRILADKMKVDKVVASAKSSLDKTTKEVNNAVKSL